MNGYYMIENFGYRHSIENIVVQSTSQVACAVARVPFDSIVDVKLVFTYTYLYVYICIDYLSNLI